MRSLVGALTSVALTVPALALLATPTSASAAGQTVDPTTLGTSAATAAGSCWEIKQQRPSATDGAYWLETPAMTEPAQFYCDQTTDGGGWVLVGKGRDGWVNDYVGKGDASALLTPDTTPMSSTTVQLPATAVDGLLNNGRVDALPDGIRLRRALDTTGSTWQEDRFAYASRDRWVWGFAAEHALGSWSIGTATGTGGTTQSSWGTDQAYNRINPTGQDAQLLHLGFAYGSSVAGSSADSSYLWSAVDGQGGALPYTQMYLRPKVTSSDAGFTAIADAGTKAVTQPAVPRSRALDSPWGVSGLAGSTSVEGDVEVQAFTQSGNTMYVGGNFATVQKDAAGTGAVAQPFLAAFDITTGELVTTFRPVLNEQVKALATLPDGTVVAAGDFTSANGQPASAIVDLDPTTGATVSTFKLTVENRLAGGTLRIRALDVQSGYLYLGGAFTHLTGGTRSTAVYARNLARVSVANGTPSTDWAPAPGGSVIALDATADGTRVYAAGYFTNRAMAVSTASGAAIAAWTPTWSKAGGENYQQAVTEAGPGRVFVGGSEHSLFGFDTTTLARTSGSIMKQNGDIQAVNYNTATGTLLAGCHCNDFSYQNAFSWPSLNSDWTEADALNWFGAWNGTTGARLPQFVPQLTMRRGSGIWALKTDTLGNVWAGGDLATATTKTTANKWSGGFARFDASDSTAPATPAGFTKSGETSDSVTFTWSTVSDPSAVHYDVLRDDRTVGVTTSNVGSLTVPKGGGGRFYLRAVDGAGNVSASTPVLVVGSGLIAPTASYTWTADHSKVSVDGSASSTPNGTVSDYLWDFGDSSGAHGAIASHTYAAAGSYVVRLTVTDSAGATASTSQTVTVGTPAAAGPTDVYGAEVYGESPYLYYRLGETTGTTVADSGPDSRTGTFSGTASRGVQGALRNSSDPALGLLGQSAYVVAPDRATTAPNEFSLDIWFKTTSDQGGRLIGYANTNTGLSSQYDRHLFLQNDGKLVFGVYPGSEQRVTSTSSYNDGSWHQAVATLSPTAGMQLYVDGALIGSNAAVTSGEGFLGYWKVGGDRIWGGANTGYLTGSLDEAAVFTKAITAAQVAEQWRLGSTVVTTPVSAPPTAAFGATVNNLSATLDASASTDPDGTIASYRWDFGDGSTGTGQVASHTYAAAGSYTVSLTVTDNSGQLSTATKTVTATSPPVTSVVVDNAQSWRWRYVTGAPAAGWNTSAFDASTWSTGTAPLGFGSTGLGTNIDTFSSTSSRPQAAYFSKTFQVSDASKVTRLLLSTYADDGVVVYVNGTEVARSSMPTGTIGSTTFATAARRTSVATASPISIEVPVGLLTSGTNVIAAETHLNSRNTTDASFDLKATMTSAAPTTGGSQAPTASFTSAVSGTVGSFDASASADPDGTIGDYSWDFGDGTFGSGRLVSHTFAPGSYTVTLTVTDNSGRSGTSTASVNAQAQATTSTVVAAGSAWRWRYATTAPPADWNSRTFDASSWSTGNGVLGFGAPTVVTNIDTFASTSTRPQAAYFTKSIQLTDLAKLSRLSITTVADDGLVLYVNGTEVTRSNMPAGTVTSTTTATSARRYTVANANPVTVDVPLSLLVDGTNVISAETHVNFRATADMTFDLQATATRQP